MKYRTKFPKLIKKGQLKYSKNNRGTYIYKLDKSGEILEIVCVSLEILIKNKWVTIVRYDTYHGQIHKHLRLSYESNATVVVNCGLSNDLTKHMLLTWAIKDISKNYISYKKEFVDKCGLELELW